MIRYFLEFSYHGKNYHGWQRQPKAISVQEVLEETISTLLREKTEVIGAGRTDSGVHAKQMFAHFDGTHAINLREVKHKLNAFLPRDIAIHAIREVVKEAHARFDATSRTYEYWMTTVKNPFLVDYSYHFYRELDIEKMNEASTLLLEYEDFECFSKKHTDVNTYLCNIDHAEWKWHNEVLVFTITANRFLRNMVRAIVGTLLDVGTLKSSIHDFRTIIENKKREYAGFSVPANGLYLTKVTYPYTIFKNHE